MHNSLQYLPPQPLRLYHFHNGHEDILIFTVEKNLTHWHDICSSCFASRSSGNVNQMLIGGDFRVGAKYFEKDLSKFQVQSQCTCT